MKKFFKIVLWTILILVVISLVAVFVFIKTFDLNKYKSQIAEIVYEQTGRELKLNGHAGLKISLIPTIELNDVTFSNASWAKEKDMVKVQNVDVSFSVMPLFKKEIVIDKIHLIKPHIYLSVNEQGKPNWDFSKIESKKDSESVQNKTEVSGEDVAKGVMLAGVVAKSFKIEDGVITYSDLKNKTTTEVKINNVALTSEGMNEEIKAVFDVAFNNQKISGDVVAGSINSILQNASLYPIDAKIKAFGADIKVKGNLSDLMSAIKYDLSVIANNPSGNFGMPAVKFDGTVKGNLQNVQINITSLDVAGNIIKGNATADIKGKKPNIKATLNSNLIDVQKFNSVKKASLGLSFIGTAHAATFVPDTNIDLSVLNLINANIGLDIKKLILNQDISFDNVKTDIAVNSGNATVNVKQLGVGGGNVSGSLSANTNNNFKVDLTGKNIILQNFVQSLKATDKNYFGFVNGGKTDLLIKLNGNGKTVRSVVENLNGQVIVVVGESKIQTGNFKYFSGNFVSQILSSLKLQNLDKNMEMSCAVVRADIINSKMVFPKGVAVKTNRITIVSDGDINLKNDNIDLTIRPFNGKLADTNVVQAISSLLKVSGTINKPRLTIDNSAVITNIVGYAAGGPAFLGSQLLLDVDDYPCYTALKGTSYETMFPAPSGVKATGQNIYQGASDVVNGGINLVNDAAKGMMNLLKGKK